MIRVMDFDGVRVLGICAPSEPPHGLRARYEIRMGDDSRRFWSRIVFDCGLLNAAGVRNDYDARMLLDQLAERLDQALVKVQES